MARREAGATDSRNEVVLVGRMAAPVVERDLPSGDVVSSFRVVVDRPPPTRPSGARPVLVDTVDCAAWTGRLRRTARTLQPGDVVEVQGALRRRFWRAGGGPASRYEVEVRAVRRLARAAPPVTRRGRAARVSTADDHPRDHEPAQDPDGAA